MTVIIRMMTRTTTHDTWLTMNRRTNSRGRHSREKDVNDPTGRDHRLRV